MHRWIALLSAGLLLAGPALAGKKKGRKGKKKDPEPAAVEQPVEPQAEEASAEPETPTLPDVSDLPKVELPCGYDEGHTVRYRVEKRSSEVVPGMPEPVEGSSVSEVTLSVVTAAADAVTIELRYDKTELGSETEQAADPVSRALSEKLSQVLVDKPVRLELDREARDLSIGNIDEVSQLFTDVVKETVALLEEQGNAMPPEAVEMLEEMVADPQMVSASLLEDVRPLFDYTCGPFPVGTLPYEIPVENPIGGSPLPGEGTTTLHPPADGVARFEATEQLDDARATPVLKAMLPPDVPIDVDSLGVVSQTVLSVRVDTTDGWVRAWSHERTVGAMGRSRTDVIEMTRIDG